MIRKRIKKRRNPSAEEELRERRLRIYLILKHYLCNVIKDGNPEDLVDCIILYKQGRVCADCYQPLLKERPKEYFQCICEKCDVCGFRRDLCYLDIEYKGLEKENYSEEERERVKEAGYELILEILADDVYNDGRKYTIIPDIEDKNLNKLKKDFLNKTLRKDNIDLSYAKLSKTDLSEANLSEANLSEANLSEANLSEANLSEANLSYADLTGADLSVANLTRANLTAANLAGANLAGANLAGANLAAADLSKTNLLRANFTGALIKNTNFDKALYINKAIGLKIINPRKTLTRKKI